MYDAVMYDVTSALDRTLFAISETIAAVSDLLSFPPSIFFTDEIK